MAYFDIQVNGYGGVDFNNDDYSPQALHEVCKKLREDGVGHILATIITEDIDVMARRLRRLVELREQDDLVKELIAGLHIEGPFISGVDGFRGAHPIDAIREADLENAKKLIDAGGGLVKIFTLAPEMDSNAAVTRYLSEQGITVSAGHTDASLDQLKEGIDAGLRMFTHTGNGCPMMQNRHDNIVQRALFLREDLWLCFIADGVHVPFYALKNYLDLARETGQCIVTTDAMAAAGLGPGIHRLARWEVLVGEDHAAWAPDRSHLVGSAMSMPMAVKNLSEQLNLTADEVKELVDLGPRRALGMQIS